MSAILNAIFIRNWNFPWADWSLLRFSRGGGGCWGEGMRRGWNYDDGPIRGQKEAFPPSFTTPAESLSAFIVFTRVLHIKSVINRAIGGVGESGLLRTAIGRERPNAQGFYQELEHVGLKFISRKRSRVMLVCVCVLENWIGIKARRRVSSPPPLCFQLNFSPRKSVVFNTWCSINSFSGREDGFMARLSLRLFYLFTFSLITFFF